MVGLRRIIILSLWCIAAVGNFSLGAREGINVYFSPQDRPTNHLLDLIKQTKTSITIAMYMLTDGRVADCLVQAKLRGIQIKIALDPTSFQGLYSKADYLAQAGIEIYAFDPKKKVTQIRAGDERWGAVDALLHDKFAIFDQETVWTGSFNWTVSANVRNHENVIVIKDTEIAKAYQAEFDLLVNNVCTKYVSPVVH